MNISSLIYGVLLFLGAHIITWFQLNGQFKWDWFVKNEWLMVLVGVPISFLYIWATKYSVNSFNGLLWPTRFIGFGVGIIIYAILVSYFFSEGFNIKTIISILLSVILICIQAFWK